MFSWISNSMIMVWLAAGIIILFCRVATKKMAHIPHGVQNFAEWLVESLYDFFGSILGDHLVKRTFWFFGATFMLILTVNYLALIPGVGTIYREGADGHVIGFLRGGNADLNMTAAMSLTFFGLWLYVKLALVIILIIYHIACFKYLIDFKYKKNKHSHIFYRWFNEIPVVLLIAIILMVELKPL